MMELNDRELPGLAVALRGEALLELLRTHLPECGSTLELEAVNVLDVRYEPGARCDLLYRVRGVDVESGSRVRQLVSARLLRSDEAPEPPPPDLVQRYRERVTEGLRTPWLFLHGPRLALQAYPLDPALPWLFDAVSETAVQAGLTRMWEERKVRVKRVRVERLGHTPGARAAFDYHVLAESKRTGDLELRQLIGKMHAKKPAARLFAGSWALWQAARLRVDLAPPIGYSTPLNLTFQERVPGTRLGGMAGSSSFTQHARRTARAIAELHGLEFPLWSRRKPTEEARVVQRWSAVLMAIRPDLARRIERLRDRLVRELEARTTLQGPVHGDFHHTNVLVHGDRITIIDLDEMAFGDPLLDVGRFMASTRIPSLRTFGSVDGLEEAREVFLAEYLRRRPNDEKRARLFEAATLFTAAASAFRIQRTNWWEEVDLLLGEAERTHARARAGGAAATPGKLSPFEPTADPRPWLADPVYMRALLQPHVESAWGAEPTSCTVREVSPDGDRAIYRLKGWRAGRRWSVDVTASRAGNGAGLIQRLEILREGLAGVPDAPVLPRPIGYIRALSMMLFDVPKGTPLAALVGTGRAEDSVIRLARALAVMHGASVEVDRARSVHAEIRTLHRRADQLRGVHPELGERVSALAGHVARLVESAPQWTVPVLRTLPAQHVLMDGDRVRLGKVEDVTMAHPFIDTADFLARLALTGLKQGCVHEIDGLSRRFRDAYGSGSGRNLDSLSGFEAGALLRLACVHAVREPGSAGAERLVAQAETLLSAA